uniref:Uncharacterized protein n=1 Tax=Rhizophora mucronata TaxID=61149 RepID=A0A2P2NG90_RHIMU
MPMPWPLILYCITHVLAIPYLLVPTLSPYARISIRCYQFAYILKANELKRLTKSYQTKCIYYN